MQYYWKKLFQGAVLINSLAGFAQLVIAAHPVQSSSPIGVMGSHTHEEGGWMLSYRYMRMDMDGMLNGSDSVATPLPGFMVSPLNMTMDMHMLGGMYALRSDLTLMLMVPMLDVSMDHRVNMNSVEFTTETDGFGDVKLSGIYVLKGNNGDKVLLNLGLSVPTGSIDETGVIPASAPNAVQLPYPMQIGSGTYDLLPGISWIKQTNETETGVQLNATLRLGENDNGYTLGNRYALTGWYSKNINQALSGSVRLAAQHWKNIDGADTRLAPMPTVPTKNTNLRAGKRFDLLLGLSWQTGSHHQGHRIAMEIGKPVHQDLDGPQLETDLIFTLGWQGTY